MDFLRRLLSLFVFRAPTTQEKWPDVEWLKHVSLPRTGSRFSVSLANPTPDQLVLQDARGMTEAIRLIHGFPVGTFCYPLPGDSLIVEGRTANGQVVLYDETVCAQVVSRRIAEDAEWWERQEISGNQHSARLRRISRFPFGFFFATLYDLAHRLRHPLRGPHQHVRLWKNLAKTRAAPTFDVCVKGQLVFYQPVATQAMSGAWVRLDHPRLGRIAGFQREMTIGGGPVKPFLVGIPVQIRGQIAFGDADAPGVVWILSIKPGHP